MATTDIFEDLEVWKLAKGICRAVNNLFVTTSMGNNFGLRNQIERSSDSIMDNIAEGFERSGNTEFRNFLSYSKGTTGELVAEAYHTYNKNELLINDSMIFWIYTVLKIIKLWPLYPTCEIRI